MRDAFVPGLVVNAAPANIDKQKVHHHLELSRQTAKIARAQAAGLDGLIRLPGLSRLFFEAV